MTKRFVAAALLVGGLLTACGQAPGATSPARSADAAQEQPKGPDLDAYDPG